MVPSSVASASRRWVAASLTCSGPQQLPRTQRTWYAHTAAAQQPLPKLCDREATDAELLCPSLQLLAAMTSGALQLVDATTGQVMAERAGVGELIGLGTFPSSTEPSPAASHLISCTAAGALTVQRFTELLPSFPSPASLPAPIPAFTLGSNLTRLRVSPFPSSPLVASGGVEQLLRLHDLHTGQVHWKARALPHDRLNLRCPVHLTDVRFLHSEPHVLLEGTATRHLRAYDTRASKRPALSLQVGEHAVAALAVTADDRHVLVGDVAGEVRAVDRRMARVVGGYHGIGGGVRALEVSGDGAVLACGGLDRHVRLYEVGSRRVVRKVYVKQKVNVVMWSGKEVKEEGVKEEEVEAEEEEGMWRELEERRKAAAKKRKGDATKVKDEEEEIKPAKAPRLAAAEDEGEVDDDDVELIGASCGEGPLKAEEEEEEEEEEAGEAGEEHPDEQGEEEPSEEEEEDKESESAESEVEERAPARTTAKRLPVHRVQRR